MRLLSALVIMFCSTAVVGYSQEGGEAPVVVDTPAGDAGGEVAAGE